MPVGTLIDTTVYFVDQNDGACFRQKKQTKSTPGQVRFHSQVLFTVSMTTKHQQKVHQTCQVPPDLGVYKRHAENPSCDVLLEQDRIRSLTSKVTRYYAFASHRMDKLEMFIMMLSLLRSSHASIS